MNTRRSRRSMVLAGGLALLVAACGSPGTRPHPTGGTPASPTVWLCRPGQADDPCAGDLDATAVSANGSTAPVPDRVDPASKFDCFYVYPTVSPENDDNADLRIQPAETAVAQAQAAPFSSVCHVWAPMYRQTTLLGLTRGFGGDPASAGEAYGSLLSGWKDYLAHHNDGRPIVFIGHSQGAAILIKLLRQMIDPDAELRRRMVSAIILGGNVQVAAGSITGGSFQHIPLCESGGASGCVIAYSTFGSTPPPAALFGRPGQGVSLLSGQTRSADRQVACTNPADLAGGPGALETEYPRATSPTPGITVTTPWVSYPGLYTAACRRVGGATWLQVTTAEGPGDLRPEVKARLGPDWGYHVDDVNLALGNLVTDVAAQETAHLSGR